MRTKSIILIIIAAVITLSFTLGSVNKSERGPKANSSKKADSEPVGGFVSEDKY